MATARSNVPVVADSGLSGDSSVPDGSAVRSNTARSGGGGLSQDLLNGSHSGATESLAASSLSSAQVDVLECAICLQPCVHPVRLPCTHVFCYLCVKGVASHSRRCALCRAEIPQDYVCRPQLLSRDQLVLPAAPPPTMSDADGETSEDDSSKYHWYYEGVGGWWEYDERTNIELEKYRSRLVDKTAQDVDSGSDVDGNDGGGRATPAVFELLIAGFIYVIDLDNLVQYRRGYPGRRRRIKRDLVGIQDCKGIAGLKCRKKPVQERSGGDGDERLRDARTAAAAAAAAPSVSGTRQAVSSSGSTIAVGRPVNAAASRAGVGAAVSPASDRVPTRTDVTQQVAVASTDSSPSRTAAGSAADGLSQRIAGLNLFGIRHRQPHVDSSQQDTGGQPRADAIDLRRANCRTTNSQQRSDNLPGTDGSSAVDSSSRGPRAETGRVNGTRTGQPRADSRPRPDAPGSDNAQRTDPRRANAADQQSRPITGQPQASDRSRHDPTMSDNLVTAGPRSGQRRPAEVQRPSPHGNSFDSDD